MVTYECIKCNAVIRQVVCPKCHGNNLRRHQYTNFVRCKCGEKLLLSELVCPYCLTTSWEYAVPGDYPQCRICEHPLNEKKERTYKDDGVQIWCIKRKVWMEVTGSCPNFYKKNIRNVTPKFLRR